jgi:hypothetical protein
VERALAIACSMARRMHSWSYSRLAMLLSCHVCGAFLPLDEKTMSYEYSVVFLFEKTMSSIVF